MEAKDLLTQTCLAQGTFHDFFSCVVEMYF